MPPSLAGDAVGLKGFGLARDADRKQQQTTLARESQDALARALPAGGPAISKGVAGHAANCPVAITAAW